MSKNYKLTGFADEISNNLQEQISGIRGLSMNHIEMRGVDGDNLIFHTDDKVKEIKKRLDDAGITLSALGSPLGKIGITDSFEKHFEEFKRATEIAHMMETPNIRMFSFYVPEDKHAEYKGEVFDRLGRFADYAKSNDVVLLHENEKGIYGDKAAECREIMDEFYGEHFKAIFDFANFVQCGQDTLEAYDLLKDFIVYVHVKDALKKDGSVVPAGLGDGNVAEILGKLFDKGFDGFLSLEPHLFDFVGFADLEQAAVSIKTGEGKKLTGLEAFTLAHSALLKILE
ncbi:sugar phosphate isomerase/epimerase family protein [Butyrivibrio proteoclasticus]|uniref:sugar phosphate isomerase/epimerase family protein n=1 Tax=Butyrivibrio proteoclasticus TaxID=43305 RepID=UPI00047ECE3E|nr:sugar phosphate isomerase/epimerase family protein [Butyrivibrio proteoclasticus]